MMCVVSLSVVRLSVVRLSVVRLNVAASAPARVSLIYEEK
jgi:hypothetical protein